MEIEAAHLTRDPELKSYSNGTTVCYISVAFDARRSGGREKKTEFRSLRVYGKQAEACARYLKKGSAVMYAGELTISAYMRKDGEPGANGTVAVQDIKFLNTKTSEEEPEQKQGSEPTDDDLAGFQTISDAEIPF